MKFKQGDSIDVQHCAALQHEFLRCHDAYIDFVTVATSTIAVGDSSLSSYRMFNAYARFLHHLYEFMVGALVREHGDTSVATKRGAYTLIERYITGHAMRLLKNKREAIERAQVPGWQSALAGLPASVPADFAAEFRKHRNTMAGHVKYERASLKLSEFFDRFQFFMFILYRDCYSWWGRTGGVIPDLGEITRFSVLVRQQAGSLQTGQTP
jgi:hypothetical protein